MVLTKHAVIVAILQMWDDPTLVNKGTDGAACFDPHGGWVPAWVPQLRFHNEYEQLYQWARKFRITDVEKGRVEAKLGFRGAFYDAMELHAFPFDRQVLNMVISSDDPTSKMMFCQHPSKKTTSVLKEHLQEWTLGTKLGKEEGAVCASCALCLLLWLFCCAVCMPSVRRLCSHKSLCW